MKATDKEIHDQGSFVTRLSQRLTEDVLSYESSNCDCHHTRIQEDIKRLRRELNTLSKMFNYDWRGSR